MEERAESQSPRLRRKLCLLSELNQISPLFVIVMQNINRIPFAVLEEENHLETEPHVSFNAVQRAVTITERTTGARTD